MNKQSVFVSSNIKNYMISRPNIRRPVAIPYIQKFGPSGFRRFRFPSSEGPKSSGLPLHEFLDFVQSDQRHPKRFWSCLPWSWQNNSRFGKDVNNFVTILVKNCARMTSDEIMTGAPAFGKAPPQALPGERFRGGSYPGLPRIDPGYTRWQDEVRQVRQRRAIFQRSEVGGSRGTKAPPTLLEAKVREKGPPAYAQVAFA